MIAIDMDMPMECHECRFQLKFKNGEADDYYNRRCVIEGRTIVYPRPDWCPLRQAVNLKARTILTGNVAPGIETEWAKRVIITNFVKMLQESCAMRFEEGKDICTGRDTITALLDVILPEGMTVAQALKLIKGVEPGVD